MCGAGCKCSLLVAEMFLHTIFSSHFSTFSTSSRQFHFFKDRFVEEVFKSYMRQLLSHFQIGFRFRALFHLSVLHLQFVLVNKVFVLLFPTKSFF